MSFNVCFLGSKNVDTLIDIKMSNFLKIFTKSLEEIIVVFDKIILTKS